MTARNQNQTTTLRPSLLKNILQNNKRVGRQKAEIPELTTFVTEQFLEEFILKLTKGDQNEIKIENIIELIQSDQSYDFLIPIIPRLNELNQKGKPTASKINEDD